VLHAALYLTVVLWVLSPLKALAFVAVQQAVFSLYLGISFAPNHKGMPVIESATAAGFARRQVVTARNITGGRFTDFMLGGLNYQIEHHLFPSMPRPSLRRVHDGKVILPGVVTHSANVVEHPELVADRIVRFAEAVGREGRQP
jgi:fatty acid desaturase